MFKFDFDDDCELQKLQQIETDAILDQKWFGSKLMTVSSIGNVETYELLQDDKVLEKRSTISLNESGGDDKILALSIDIDKLADGRFLVSDSRGQISLIDASTQKIVTQWLGHSFEAWSCAFDCWNANVVYSGKFLCNDILFLKLKK